MAAEFLKVINMQGFDRFASPKWQMVPVSGKRYLALRDGAGLTVTSNNPAVTVREIKQAEIPKGGERMPLNHGDRIFELTGAGKGHARLQAKSGGVIKAEVQVDTKNKKTVRLTFNFVHDSAGHHTKRATASAAGWVKKINEIYNGQANTFVTLKLARKVAVTSNLGQIVMWKAGASSEWNTVVALGDSGADMNFFLVWEYEQDATPYHDDTDAGTLGSNCIFEDKAGTAIGVTMGHEMGHFLGVNDHYDNSHSFDLMYGITDKRGVNLRMSDVNVMNP